MRKTHLIGSAAALLIVAGAIVAAGGSSTRPTTQADTAAAARSVSGPVAAATAAGGAGVAADLAAPEQTVSRAVPGVPRVVKTASLALSVGDDRVKKVADATASLASRLGGFVASTQQQSDEGRAATITLRVPTSTFDEALGELRKLGKVTSEELSGADVTGQLVDLDARVRSLKAQEQALNALLVKAATVGETLQVAQASADVRTQIEQLSAQQQTLADQADFATITTTIVGPHGTIPSEPKPEPLLVKSVRDAGHAALSVVGGMLVVLAFVLPLALMAGTAYGAWRVVTRRRQGVALAGDGAV